MASRSISVIRLAVVTMLALLLFLVASESQPASATAVDADPQVLDITVARPASAVTGVPFDVTVNASLRNNGPSGPVNVPVDFTFASPADCKRTPGGPFETATVSLGVGHCRFRV
jgi:hypothetical protein